MSNLITKILTVIAVLAVVCSAALSGDVIKLKNGKTLEGKIIEETADYVKIEITAGSIVKPMMLWVDDIESIERESDQVDESDASATVTVSGTPGMSSRSDGEAKPEITEDTTNKRVVVIPMKGGVGETFRMDKLKEAIDASRPHNPDVIILRIDSPGGLLSEIYKLRDYLREVRDEFRIVVWIKSAISAAAMTSFNVREMYFMKEGHIGAATAWLPSTGESLQGEALEQWVADARDMFESTGWSPLIAQAMIDEKYWLTADVEYLENGEKVVTWYEHDGGEIVLSRPGENLVLDAVQARELGIAHEICDNEEELAKALNLDGWVEVSDEGRKIMENWIKTVEKADREVPKLLIRYNAIQGMAGDRNTILGQQAQILRELIRWGKRFPEDLAMMRGLYVPELERELKRVLAQMDR